MITSILHLQGISYLKAAEQSPVKISIHKGVSDRGTFREKKMRLWDEMSTLSPGKVNVLADPA